MATRLITAPAAEPLSLEEAKAHLRVDHTTDDSLIAIFLQAARQDCEEWTQRAFITQTWEVVIDEFPENEILIPRPPLQSVTSVKYDDGAGVEVTLSAAEYTVDTASEPGWIVPTLSGWPATFDGINAVRVQYVAGYATSGNSPDNLADNVPGPIKAAILLRLGQLYEHREDVIAGTTALAVPNGTQFLLRPYRMALGMA